LIERCCSDPFGDITINSTSCRNAELNFSGDYAGQDLSFDIDWGDGISGTYDEWNALHNYDIAGNYEIKVFVVTSAFCDATEKTLSFKVVDGDAQIQVVQDNQCSRSVILKSSVQDLYDKKWEIEGLVHGSAGPDYLYTFDDAGTYLVKLTGVTGDRCPYSDEITITIEDGPSIALISLSSEEIVKDVDENVYTSVIIGEQQWMSENLRTTKYSDGTAIPNVKDENNWNNLTSGAWSHYDNDNQYETTYGKLYNWYAVETGKLCPTGWHVPTNAEWTVLTDYLASNGNSGSKGIALKSTSGWDNNRYGVIGNGTDDYGWNGLPGGLRRYSGSRRYWANGWVDHDNSDWRVNPPFDDVGSEGRWWSSSVNSLYNAWNYILFGGSASLWVSYGDGIYHCRSQGCGKALTRGNQLQKNGLSVRCLKDDKVCNSESIKFELESESTLENVQWNFGDGTNVSGDLNQEHTYANPGTYTVTATGTSAEGCLFTEQNEVIITPCFDLKAELSVPEKVLVGETFTIQHNSDPWPIKVSLAENDANYRQVWGSSKKFTYNEAGSYDFYVKVENLQNSGFEDIVKKTVVVENFCDEPKVPISIKRHGCRAAQIIFGDKSLNYTVDWGNGTIDNNINVWWNKHIYPKGNNSYDIKVTVDYNDNCPPKVVHGTFKSTCKGNRNIQMRDYSEPNIVNEFEKTSLEVYPNPTNQKAIISLSNSDDFTNLRITDLKGVTVLTKTSSVLGNVEVDVSTIDPGTYFVSVVWDNQILTTSLVVIH
jgi:uncharacterized protein (TIGR02145 family)